MHAPAHGKPLSNTDFTCALKRIIRWNLTCGAFAAIVYLVERIPS